MLCDDTYLLDLNNRYLNHNTLTDIITFPYSSHPINAEIYISLDRIIENAKVYAINDILSELHRVIVHGLLHMCGHDDCSEPLKSKMRELESKYLRDLNSIA